MCVCLVALGLFMSLPGWVFVCLVPVTAGFGNALVVVCVIMWVTLLGCVFG